MARKELHVVEIREPIMCQFHGFREAKFDAKTQQGPWAYVCPRCFREHCYPESLELAYRLKVVRG